MTSENPYKPAADLSVGYPTRHRWFYFVLGTVIGLNVYLGCRRGISTFIPDLVSDPMSWFGPTLVFAVAAVPFGLASGLAWRTQQSRVEAILARIMGGVLFAVLPFQLADPLDKLAELFGLSGSEWGFVLAVVFAGLIALLFQSSISSFMHRESSRQSHDEPFF